MARYVVLEFDNDDEADGFLSAFGITVSIGEVVSKDDSCRAIGVYQKPTQFCECVTRDDKSVRGAKHGWWLCAKCAKPKRGNMQHPLNKLRPDLKPREQMQEMYLGVKEPRAKGDTAQATPA